MVNGVVTPLVVALQPLPSFNIAVVVTNALTGEPVVDAEVLIQNEFFTETAFTDASGIATAQAYEPGAIEIYVGKWGYRTLLLSPFVTTNNNNFNVSLTPGYYDDFFFDYGWTVGGDASSGQWELVKPIVSFFAGLPSNAGADVGTDFGDYCFVTGNGGTGIVNNVNNGTTILTSPAFDLTGYANPELRYYRYLAFQDGSNDTLRILISNGIDTVSVEEVRDGDPFEYGFHQSIANIADLLQITDNMHLMVTISDLPTSGHVVEAAFDVFEIVEGISPVASFTAANATESCSSLEVQFVSTATSGADLQWSFPGGFPSESTEASPVVSYASAGSYPVSLTATNDLGSDLTTVEDLVVVFPAPNLSIVAPTLACQAAGFEMSAMVETPVETYLWSGVGMASDGDATVVATVNTVGSQTYTLSIVDDNGCVDASTVTVEVQAAPQFSAFAAEDTVCVGASITLQADAGEYNYTWTGGDNIFTPLLPNYGFVLTTAPNSSGDTYYTASATDPTNGCVTSQEVLVSAIDPITNLLAPIYVCWGDEVTLIVTGDMATFSGWVWRQNGTILPDTSPTITAIVTEQTTFSAQITTAGCTDMDSAIVGMSPMPEITAVASGIINGSSVEGETCWGVPFLLQATYEDGFGLNTHIWEGENVEDPDSLNTYATYIGTEDTAIYYFTLTTGEGCERTIDVNVVINTSISCFESIDETELQPLFTLQPNPTNNGAFTINANLPASTEPVLIEVFNVLGQTVYREEIFVQNNTLSHVVALPNYSPGIYYVRLNTSGGQYSSSLICR